MKAKYAERNSNLFADYQAGMSYTDLVKKYNVKIKNAQVIVHYAKKKLGLIPKTQYKKKATKQKYIIVIAEIKDIEKMVAEKLKQGYKPTGNVFEVRTGLFTTKMAQPMFKA